MDNKELINKIQNGDTGAFKYLFDSQSEAMYYYATNFVDSDTAKDIVQDVFYSLWTNKEIEIKESVTAYIFRMVRNKSLLFIDKQSVRKNYRDKKRDELTKREINYYQNNPLKSIIERELNDEFNKALEKLPEKCALVFKMSRIEEKKNKEIAEELNISVKAVEKHISKALKILKTEFKDYLPLVIYLICNK